MTVAPLGPVDYTSPTPPAGYRCSTCGVHGVKLWREYQTFLSHQTLSCGACACRAAGDDYQAVEDPDRPGHVRCGRTGRLYGDQIGWRVPAVPTADGETYWGYSSVPDEGCRWWYALPLTLPEVTRG